MSPAPEHGIKRRAPAPGLESKAIPGNMARPLDEDEDCSRMTELISSKRRHLEDGTAQTIHYKRERENVLARHRTSYRLNRHGSGVFTLNKQRRKNSGESSKVDLSSLNCQINRSSETQQEYLRQEHEQQIYEGNEKAPGEDNVWNAQLPAADGEIEVQQDAEMSMVLDTTTSKEILGQDTLPGGEAIEIEQDMETSLALYSASGEEMLGQAALVLVPQAQSQGVGHDQDKEKQVVILLEGVEAESAIEPEHNSEGGDTHETSSWDPQGCVHQDHNNPSSKRDVPVVARHETMEHHELSCTPLGGDGGVPDKGNPPALEEALARSELNDVCIEPLRQEGVAERPSSLKGQDKEDTRVHCAHSEESGDQWESDDKSTPHGQAARTGLVQVASHAGPPPAEFASTTWAPKLTPDLEFWVSSKADEARAEAQKKAEQDEEEYRQTEAVARKLMEEDMRKRGQVSYEEKCPELLKTWLGTPESLEVEVWKSIDSQIEASLCEWDDEAALKAKQRQKEYQDDEDRAASLAEKATHSLVNQGRSNVTRPTLSFIETIQQEKHKAEEAWLEREISSSSQKRYEKAMSQKLRRRQTQQVKEGGMPSAREKGKGKARDTPSSFGTSKTSTTRPPSSAQHSPSLSPISEAFHPSESHHKATMPVERFPVEELGASTSAGPSQGFVQENTPSEIPVLCQVLQGDSVEHPPLPNEHTSSIVALQGSNKKLQVLRCDQQRQSEQEAAEQRRLVRKARELEEQVKAHEYEKEQRRAKEVRDALFLTQRSIQVETGSGAKTWQAEPTPVQGESTSQIPRSSETPLHYAVRGCASGATREQCGDVNMDVDSVDSCHDAYGQHIDPAPQQLPQDSTPDPSSMSQNALLNQLIERSHVSQSTISQMARQLDELRQAVVSMANGGAIQGSSKATIAVGQVASLSNPAPPPTGMRGPLSLHVRRKGPPGTFQNPIPPPIHREDPANKFHHNCQELIQELLNQGVKNDNWPTPPTQDELNQYETSRRIADGPTQDNFRLDFITRPFHRSVWNQQAAEVFVEAYILSPSYNDEDRSKLKGEFLTRLRRIHHQYQTFLKDQESDNAEIGSTTCKSRRSSPTKKCGRRIRCTVMLYESRTTAVQSHMTMQRFIPPLERLSRGGMSEDESDHGGEDMSNQGQGEDGGDQIPQSGPKKKRYKILKVQWRSMEVTKWLRTMDLIYSGTKINEDGTAAPGNEFRKRYPSDKTQIGRPIMGLPHNFYDAKWLQALSPGQLAVLNVQPEIDINFTIDERKYAAKYIAQSSEKQKDRASSHAEADPSEVSQWALTGAGFREATHSN